MKTDISRVRNIGISAHIDSGKTTLTERMLFYTKKIHRIHEVKGKDGIGATMDSMELEKERGITITSAATHVLWKDYSINIIDTPGHVDFTIEVERSLRVLDGAVLVLCSVAGVQSQSITVDRQLKRYDVPSLAFINKCDRRGANPFKVRDQLRDKLNRNALLMQIPIGLEDKLEGVIDLVSMKAATYEGAFGEDVIIKEIPDEYREKAEGEREAMLDSLSMFSDELLEAILEDRVSEELIRETIHKATVSRELMPVFLGSAYKNKGVQSLMDAIVSYLPDPSEVQNVALDLDRNGEEVVLAPSAEEKTVALVFKLEDGHYGQLTYIRLYQGTVKRGDELLNVRTGKKFKVGRLIRMHADSMEDIQGACCGDIVALFGIDCASGDTFVHPDLNYSMSSIHVPDPVISLAVKPQDTQSSSNMAKALNRFTKEDPTFRTYVDSESNETIIQGMGELHLDVYIERMKREYDASVETGKPQVAYRETITQRVDFDYTHKKQTGGAGQFGRVVGYLEPDPEGTYSFINSIKGGHIPKEYIPSCDRGFKDALAKGSLLGFPVVHAKVVLTDGQSHPVDSSDIAFRNAAKDALRSVYTKAKPVILEPVMRVSVEGPSEFAGNVFASLNQRRGIIVSSVDDGHFSRVDADVPLSEMFGYATVLRSQSQGKAEFTMEFKSYEKVPQGIAEDLIHEFREKGK